MLTTTSHVPSSILLNPFIFASPQKPSQRGYFGDIYSNTRSKRIQMLNTTDKYIRQVPKVPVRNKRLTQENPANNTSKHKTI